MKKKPTTVSDATDTEDWQCVGFLSDIPANAGMAARIGHRQVALFHLPASQPGQAARVFALDNLEPGSGANVLSRGIVGDVAGEPVVISPLYKKRLRLRDGVSPDDSQLRVRVWPVRIVQDRIWVATEPMTVVSATVAEAL